MTPLIRRLRMLAPPNPVARVVLTEDDWPEIQALLEAHDVMTSIRESDNEQEAAR